MYTTIKGCSRANTIFPLKRKYFLLIMMYKNPIFPQNPTLPFYTVISSLDAMSQARLPSQLQINTTKSCLFPSFKFDFVFTPSVRDLSILQSCATDACPKTWSNLNNRKSIIPFTVKSNSLSWTWGSYFCLLPELISPSSWPRTTLIFSLCLYTHTQRFIYFL